MWLKFTLFGALLTLALHVFVLILNGQDPIATPISQLSRNTLGELHTLGLIVFGLSHITLAIALSGLDRGRLWPIARGLLVSSGIGLMYVAYYFATVPDDTLFAPNANDPLWIVASLTGAAMGTLQPGFSRLSHRLGLFGAICLGMWLWLVPVILFVTDSWLGAYERIVGTVYVVWVAGIALHLIISRKSPETASR
ncbi:MAG: DUF998 domain-containing protein [Woeseiaceae bacterium]